MTDSVRKLRVEMSTEDVTLLLEEMGAVLTRANKVAEHLGILLDSRDLRMLYDQPKVIAARAAYRAFMDANPPSWVGSQGR